MWNYFETVKWYVNVIYCYHHKSKQKLYFIAQDNLGSIITVCKGKIERHSDCETILDNITICHHCQNGDNHIRTNLV